jgi:CubicO group peptidase (beta-lactamase class C family)
MKKIKITLVLFLALVSNSFAQITPNEVDAVVERTLKTFNVPGIAVAIVKDGAVVLAKGTA